ncbi:unnamed protein product [Linum trigynum]|uniref:Uncharacterized protein n=1 Tax=Linum trigynum TaxID=586398 RepID=A0AAV2F6X9_9ROSI
MHPKSIQVLLRTPNSRRLQTLTFDPSQPQTLRSLKLSLIPNHGNPDAFYYRQRELLCACLIASSIPSADRICKRVSNLLPSPPFHLSPLSL